MFDISSQGLRWWRQYVIETILPGEQQAQQRIGKEMHEAIEQLSRAKDNKSQNVLTNEIEALGDALILLSGEGLKGFCIKELSDSQFSRYFELRQGYMETKNPYWLIEAFVWFVREHISPPSWVLLPLALSFQKHLKSPDTDQLAYQLGLKGRGSGTTSPHDAYKHEKGLEPVLYDLMILIVAFRLTKTDAAKACAIKYGLSISEKRLINIFNERPEMKQFSMNDVATRELQEHMSKQRSNYVQTFPPRARQLLAAGKRP